MKKIMSADSLEKIFGLIGVILVAGFVLGLAESISSGAAGFWGGFPFWSATRKNWIARLGRYPSKPRVPVGDHRMQNLS